MPFIKDVVKFQSLSIVGLEKNTGKTECLNYVLDRLKEQSKVVAVTSIGIDGESLDQVTQTPKPTVAIYPNMLFVTAEKLYRQKELVAEVVNVSNKSTALGRLITAKAITKGKVILAGPPDTAGLKNLIEDNAKRGVELTIVDGALSRISLASPAITSAMILATGAAYSANIAELVRKTKYAVDLIRIEEVEADLKSKLANSESGFWAVTPNQEVVNLNIQSVYMLDKDKSTLLQHGTTIFVGGAVTDKLLNSIRNQNQCNKTTIIAKDFTKIFVTPETYRAYIKKGGKIKVLQQTKLIAVCINPQSPDGYLLNSLELQKAMSDALMLPVYDIKKI